MAPQNAPNAKPRCISIARGIRCDVHEVEILTMPIWHSLLYSHVSSHDLSLSAGVKDWRADGLASVSGGLSQDSADIVRSWATIMDNG